MGDVVDLAQHKAENQPHLAGKIRCMNCKHEWWGVVPVVALAESCPECPACGTYQGAFVDAPLQNDGLVWSCACENDLFRITPDGNGFRMYCAHCGKDADPG